MLVSAITENFYQTLKSTGFSNKSINKNKKECVNDTAFNSLSPQVKHVANEDRNRVYCSINEWKDFCHKQIVNGKLDVIA